MKKTMLSLAFICICALNVQAQESNTYQNSLREMLNTSGAAATFQSAITQIINIYKQQKPTVPDEVWSEFETSIKKTSIDDLTRLLTPVYQKHLSQDDLQAITDFYNTPVGKKFANETPAITEESMQVGQQWGMQLTQEVMAKLKEKGY